MAPPVRHDTSGGAEVPNAAVAYPIRGGCVLRFRFNSTSSGKSHLNTCGSRLNAEGCGVKSCDKKTIDPKKHLVPFKFQSMFFGDTRPVSAETCEACGHTVLRWSLKRSRSTR